MRRLVALASTGLIACSLLTSLDDLRGDAGSDATSDAPQCAADTSSDAHNCGACGHDCCGGQCVNGLCQPLVLASQQPNPGWVVADDTHVYWQLNAVTSPPFPPPNTDVMRVRVDGSALETFAHARPIFFSIQSDGTRIVWMEASIKTPGVFHVAWLDKSAVGDDAGDAGGTVQTAPAIDPAASTGFMTGFVVTPASTYWLASSSTECPGVGAACVYVAPSSNLASYTVVHTSFAPYSIAQGSFDTHYIYPWTNTGRIYRVDTTQIDAGFPADLLVSAANVTIDAVDPTHVYWSDSKAGTIYVAPITPSDAAPSALATLQNVPGGILADNGSVYWANADGIVTCPATGCPDGADKPRVIVQEQGISYFTATSKCFFYTNPAAGTVKVVGR